MRVRYALAPQAAVDLVEIWRYIKEQSSLTIADRVECAIREKIAFLAGAPGAGHGRKHLTEENVKFFPVHAYLIVYRSATKSLQIVSILHGLPKKIRATWNKNI
jgi:plasmid stabilization system protein ParE